MAILSRLARVNRVLVTPVRHGGGGIGGQVPVRPSRMAYDKYKDELHFYLMLGAIPLGLVILYANIFHGRAQLSPIPDGYVPSEYEYYRHPITRFIVKCFGRGGTQEDYEFRMGKVWKEVNESRHWALQREVERQMKLNEDYLGWFTRTQSAQYHRMCKASREFNQSYAGFKE
uniref:NADH dehydrogenase [ubiquinone] 1 beta subcomplex subunit 5, mitochondrial n=1 Tax=Acartia pacifica TaxID=335913 RepID=A0A0U2TJE5_ACAPC|nr:NADH dehydrogenase [Acartia pacifica]